VSGVVDDDVDAARFGQDCRDRPASADTTSAKSAGVPSCSTTPPNAPSVVPVAISSQDCQHRRDVLMISHELADMADDHRGPTLAMAASRTYLTGRAVSDDSDHPGL
jgi:hypothetical protein